MGNAGRNGGEYYTPRPLIRNKLDELHDETQRLEFIYLRKLSALDALKKSLLHEAFSGRLQARPRERQSPDWRVEKR
jgi:hypothetical protein